MHTEPSSPPEADFGWADDLLDRMEERCQKR